MGRPRRSSASTPRTAATASRRSSKCGPAAAALSPMDWRTPRAGSSPASSLAEPGEVGWTSLREPARGGGAGRRSFRVGARAGHAIGRRRRAGRRRRMARRSRPDARGLSAFVWALAGTLGLGTLGGPDSQLAGPAPDRRHEQRGARHRRRRLAPENSRERGRRRTRPARAHLQPDVRPHRILAGRAQERRRPISRTICAGRWRARFSAWKRRAARARRRKKPSARSRRRSPTSTASWRRSTRFCASAKSKPARGAPDSSRSTWPRWRAKSSRRSSRPRRRRENPRRRPFRRVAACPAIGNC